MNNKKQLESYWEGPLKEKNDIEVWQTKYVLDMYEGLEVSFNDYHRAFNGKMYIVFEKLKDKKPLEIEEGIFQEKIEKYIKA